MLQVLLQFEAQPEVTVEELAQAVSASVSTTYRYVALLREVGLVEERHRGRYSLSPRVLALARTAQAVSRIASVSGPVLHRLTTDCGEAAIVVERLGELAVCVDIRQPDHPVRLSFVPGQVFPLHRGAAPKVLLAALGRDRARAYLNRIDTMTAEERRRLGAELDEIRSKGWGESAAEVDQGVWAVAAPVSVGGSVTAAVTVAAPDYRVDTGARERIRMLVRSAAKELTDALALSRP
ncbi:MAG TPA: IclR family transcriptional regulator [Natronosporangium sp.]